ncbi:hypothetical protein Tco_0013565 [Tanacetum coccineum]
MSVCSFILTPLGCVWVVRIATRACLRLTEEAERGVWLPRYNSRHGVRLPRPGSQTGKGAFGLLSPRKGAFGCEKSQLGCGWFAAAAALGLAPAEGALVEGVGNGLGLCIHQ